MYFSDPIARELHGCWNNICKIGEMDEKYPSTLPMDYCIMEVWEICGGEP